MPGKHQRRSIIDLSVIPFTVMHTMNMLFESVKYTCKHFIGTIPKYLIRNTEKEVNGSLPIEIYSYFDVDAPSIAIFHFGPAFCTLNVIIKSICSKWQLDRTFYGYKTSIWPTQVIIIILTSTRYISNNIAILRITFLMSLVTVFIFLIQLWLIL